MMNIYDFDQLTAEQENTVRRYLDKNFDVNKYLNYLCEHDVIEFDIFKISLNPQASGLQWTFLNDYKPIDRNTFINRMPIYFYDMYGARSGAMSDLFDSYKKRVKEYKTFADMRKDSRNEKSGVDYEPLYKMLEKAFYDYKVSYDELFDYINKQEGNITASMFSRWVKYAEYKIKTLNDLLRRNDERLFPKNFGYSYNVVLEEQGKEPIVYMPSGFNSRSKEDVMRISGRFPIDDNGNVVLKWCGIWTENVDEIKAILPFDEESYLADEDDIASYFAFEQHFVTLELKLKPNSRVYVLHSFSDEDSDTKKRIWDCEYTGPQVLQFDFKPILNYREKTNKSQKEIAEIAGINIRTYQRIEAGESMPDALNLIKIMSALNIHSVEQFVNTDIKDDDLSKFKSGKKPSEFLSIQSE